MSLPPSNLRTNAPLTGLVLTGGGARAAYQVGVLRAVAALRRAGGDGAGNPFPIITGTSAGAVNAAALAAGSDQYDHAVNLLTHVWRHLHATRIYRSDALSAVRAGTRWMALLSLGWAVRRWRRAHPRSLLDNAPLVNLLHAHVPLARVPEMIQGGHLHALAVSASSYASGEHITFYDAVESVQPWVRAQRRATRTTIGMQHLMASSAIPFLFPAGQLTVDGQVGWYGDGSMRQVAPISAAIHLGAERVLVIGAGRAHEPRPAHPHAAASDALPLPYPSLAQVAGHTLSSIFLDTLSADVERLQRVNRTLALISPEERAHSGLRRIDLLLISPSQRLDELAAQHVAELPASARTLLGILGVRANDARSGALASYLLFEPGYTRALMQLGWDDTLRQRAEVCRFFGWSAATREDEAAPAP